MGPKRAYVATVPGDPLSDFLAASLDAAPTPAEADAVALPRLTASTADALTAALAAGKPAFLAAESLPETLTAAVKQGLSALTARGLVICPLTALGSWVQRGASCPRLLTLERLNAFAARGIDRVYLAARPAATPLALRAAKERNIHLTGGICPGTG